VIRLRVLTVALALATSVLAPPARAAESHLAPAARSVLVRYLDALAKGNYDQAFRFLAAADRKYFKSARNFGSIFEADDLHLDSYTIVGSRSGGSLGYLALVSERVRFLDHAHQAPGSATVKVPYGLLRAGNGYVVRDPGHPWKAFRPADAAATVSGLRVTVRKVSLFSDRVEVVLTFANVAEGFVTLLPYGRSTLRDDGGTIAHPLATKLPGLMDKQLYLGLRLAAHARYTGTLDFKLNTAGVHALTLSVNPSLRDGADAPFEVQLPAMAVPADG
jgi:hypothetical protein